MTTKLKGIITSAVVCLLATGCLPSLQPLYTAQDVINKTELEGDWITGAKGKDYSVWQIRPFKKGSPTKGRKQYPHSILDKMYTLTHIERGDTIVFELYIMKLGEYHYLDFYPLEYESFNSMRNMHLFPVHTFARVTLQDDQMAIEHFDVDHLEKLIQQQKIRIGHQKSGPHIVLSAPTKELQQFVLKYANQEDTFTAPTILQKAL